MASFMEVLEAELAKDNILLSPRDDSKIKDKDLINKNVKVDKVKVELTPLDIFNHRVQSFFVALAENRLDDAYVDILGNVYI